MQLTIASNFPEVDAALERLGEQVGRPALASAMNKTVDRARVQMQREIAGQYNVTVGYVRQRLKVRKAYARGQLNLSAELIGGDGKRRSANIIAFVERSVTLAQARKRAASGTLRVLRVKVKRGQPKLLPGAFIGNKGRTVFRRVGKARLPIEPVQTIDVAQMFNTRRINQAVLRSIEVNLPAIFQREAAFYLTRFGAQ